MPELPPTPLPNPAPHRTPAQPLRILHLSAGSQPGGVARYLETLSRGLQQRDHRVTVGGERGGWHERFEAAGVRWLDLPLTGGPADLWRARRRLRRFIREQPIDLIHAHVRRAALVGRGAARAANAPLLFTLHLTDIPIHGPWRWVSEFGDRTHVPSVDAKQWLIDHARLPAEHISVVPHGIETRAYPFADAAAQQAARQQLGLPEHATLAGFLGRFEPQKNVGWLLTLARRVAAQRPEVRLLLSGEGPDRAALAQQIEDEGLGDHVTLMAGDDPLTVYQAIDALLLPSSHEGFSLVSAEAMSVGRPVLRTRTAGTSELIQEGRTGRATPLDRERFIEAALDFLADREALHRMGREAAALISRDYTFDQQVDGTVALYRAMIADHAKAGESRR